ncbi:MAG TPA: hypothetical protein VHA14_06000, partial [Bryobacteraceae bacterium]|nr:hypothetical protein [Bryobacteraceae bacterium]
RYVAALINLAVGMETLALNEVPQKDAKPAIREAAGYLETAVRLDPLNALTHLDLAIALTYFPERRANAIEEFRQTLDLQPQNATAHDKLGGLLAENPATASEGLDHLRAAQQLAPDAARAAKIAELNRQYNGHQ